MKKLFQNKKALWIACLALAGIAAVLQACAVLFCYEPNTNYFYSKNPLPLLAVICAILGAVSGSLAAFATDPTKLSRDPFSHQSIPAPSSFGFLAVVVLFLTSKQAATSKITAYLVPLTAVALLYSALYAIKPLRKRKTLFALLGFGTLLSIVLLTAYYYFDVTVEMNAPLKLSVQTGLLFALVYYTQEIRYLLGNEHPRAYLCLSACTVSVGSLSAVAAPIAYATGKLDRTDYAAGGLLVFCIVLTVLTRISTLYRAIPEETTTDMHEVTEATAPDTDGNGEKEA